MAISTKILRSAAGRYYGVNRSPRNLREAQRYNKKTAFLCHSHKDEALAKGLQVILRENGCDLYIDWDDTDMPETPNRDTAVKIQSKIQETDWFLFLATRNSIISRWCPWEIGIADSLKGCNNVIIIPTEDDDGWYGNEYLQLYRKLDKSPYEDGYSIFECNSSENTKVNRVL